jgi:hypothetical protein
MSLHLQARKIGPFPCDKDFLAMLKVTIFQVGFGANLLKVFVVIMNSAVNAVGIFCACKEILFNAFGACTFFTVFAGDAFTDNRGVSIRTNATIDFNGDNHFILNHGGNSSHPRTTIIGYLFYESTADQFF